MRKKYISEIVCYLGVVDSDCCVSHWFLVPAGICQSEAYSPSSRCVFSCVSKCQFYLPGMSFQFLLFSFVSPSVPHPFFLFFCMCVL